jgi:hypothetical protein
MISGIEHHSVRERASDSGSRAIAGASALPTQEAGDDDSQEIDLSIPTLHETLSKDLGMLTNLLRWAHHCLAMPVDPSGDIEGMRARAKFVLEEARELANKCRDDLDAAQAVATIR